MLTFHSFRASGSTYLRLYHRLPKSFNADAISSLHSVRKRHTSTVQRLHKHIEEQNVMGKIRSRAKWVEQDEKSSKYFYNLEKKNFSSNAIKQLKKTKRNGTYTTCDKEILHEQYTFYRKLYQNACIPEETIVNYLNDAKKSEYFK